MIKNTDYKEPPAEETETTGDKSSSQKTNLEIMSDNYRSLVSNAQLTMSGAKRKAYITQLTNNYDNYMKGFGHQQQKENYLWILNQNPGDRPIYFKALINDWSANDLINTTQATHLRTLVSEEYKSFMALNYENITQSLDTPTIKNNYKTLFDLEIIGKEKKKTK